MKGSVPSRVFVSGCPLTGEGCKTRAHELHVTETQIQEKLDVQRLAVLRGQIAFFFPVITLKILELICPQDFLVDSMESSGFYMVWSCHSPEPFSLACSLSKDVSEGPGGNGCF